ncbi:hypothetical protein ACFFV7_17175 [Nonomuraea spiralis]|uniref:Uncharacterized protein n=1 Tax=Nonomuraea spiralis TaxID=46182 RepID=A0ABV5IEG5_9ACTN|nr:hypothetical protein [Nonomuraea spiralis]GGS69414.1 hypothetical protein GCM10010176_009950 [Nonomuraea spiralis]
MSASSANKVIFYGRAGDDREHVEVSALALHLIQATIACLDTHLIQIVLRDAPKQRARLTPRTCAAFPLSSGATSTCTAAWNST